MATTQIQYPTDDVFKTSSGVAHHYRPGYYFPSSNFKVSRVILRRIYIID